MMTRGSKTAAEKVVRESESGPDLGSPDKRESIPPVTDMQVCGSIHSSSLGTGNVILWLYVAMSVTGPIG